jgi:hypothetical protein
LRGLGNVKNIIFVDCSRLKSLDGLTHQNHYVKLQDISVKGYSPLRNCHKVALIGCNILELKDTLANVKYRYLESVSLRRASNAILSFVTNAEIIVLKKCHMEKIEGLKKLPTVLLLECWRVKDYNDLGENQQAIVDSNIYIYHVFHKFLMFRFVIVMLMDFQVFSTFNI